MAWMDDKSVISFGTKYKGVVVSEINDRDYISWLHHSKLNVYFVQETLDRLKVVNNGLMKETKNSERLR